MAGKEKAGTEAAGPALKAVWYAAEAFGELVGWAKKARGEGAAGGDAAPAMERLGMEEAVKLIEADYAEDYFISGRGDLKAYDPDCEFSDPFVAFNGTERFRKNVSNLGGLMEDVVLNVTSFEAGDAEVVTSWKFSCILQLPWRPRLAAAGGTTHVLDPATGLVVKHIERWDVEPAEVVQGLLKPSSKIPSSRADVIMLSVSEGDLKGTWYAVSPLHLQAAALGVAVSLMHKLVTGEGFAGASHALELQAYAGVLFAAYTELNGLLGGNDRVEL